MDEAIFKMVFDVPTWVFPSLAFLLLAMYFHKRSGTSYGLFSRLYALLIGGSDFTDSSLSEFWNDRKDIERFNALFGLKAHSLHDIHLFNKWIEAYNLDIN